MFNIFYETRFCLYLIVVGGGLAVSVFGGAVRKIVFTSTMEWNLFNITPDISDVLKNLYRLCYIFFFFFRNIKFLS